MIATGVLLASATVPSAAIAMPTLGSTLAVTACSPDEEAAAAGAALYSLAAIAGRTGSAVRIDACVAALGGPASAPATPVSTKPSAAAMAGAAARFEYVRVPFSGFLATV